MGSYGEYRKNTDKDRVDLRWGIVIRSITRSASATSLNDHERFVGCPDRQ